MPLMMRHVQPIENPELTADFARMLDEQFNEELRPGQVVPGEVMRTGHEGLLVDIGGKSEANVPVREIPNCNTLAEVSEAYQPGQVLNVYVLRTHDVDQEVGYTCSIRRALAYQNWEVLEKAMAAGEVLSATVIGTTRGGVLANVMELKGFIPASQLRVTCDAKDLIGEPLNVKVLEVDRNRNKLILSQREAVLQEKSKMRKETLSKLESGDIVQGPIVKVTDFGVFVDVNGIDGLLPLSEIAWRRLGHPSEALSMGDYLELQVLSVDRDRERISLSLKRLEPDPWSNVDQRYPVGTTFSGAVSKELSTGVLVQIEPGVEAFCSTRGMAQPLFSGQVCNFEIVSIDLAERRMTLHRLEG